MRAALFGGALVVALGASAAHASDAPTSAAAMLAASCSGCHAGAGVDTSIPKLEGRAPEEIRDLMIAFQSDEEATLMNRIARGYTDEEIETIAAYLGTPSP